MTLISHAPLEHARLVVGTVVAAAAALGSLASLPRCGQFLLRTFHYTNMDLLSGLLHGATITIAQNTQHLENKLYKTNDEILTPATKL